MKTLKVLRAERVALKAEGKALYAKADAEKRDLTAEEQARADEIEASLEALDADIAKAEKRADQERAFGGESVEAEVIEGDGTTRIAGVHHTPKPTETYGFRNLAEYALAVKSASAKVNPVQDDRLAAMYQAAPANYHREQGSSDGYMVPPAFRATIWELTFNGEDLLNMVDREPTSSNQVEMNGDESTPWGQTGVQAYWRTEAEQMTPSRLNTDERSVKLNELYAFVTATDELLQDAPRLNDRLQRRSAEAIRWKASDSIYRGNGVGKPLGFMNSASLITVAKNSGQANGTVNSLNLANMFSRMLPSSIPRARWLANVSILPQLMHMTIGDKPIWLPPTGLDTAPFGTILGRPLMLTEHANALGVKGDIVFADMLGYYALTKAEEIQYAESIHLYFDYGLKAFRWTFRFGGQPYLRAAVQPPNSAPTLGHFVTLAAR